MLNIQYRSKYKDMNSTNSLTVSHIEPFLNSVCYLKYVIKIKLFGSEFWDVFGIKYSMPICFVNIDGIKFDSSYIRFVKRMCVGSSHHMTSNLTSDWLDVVFSALTVNVT